MNNLSEDIDIVSSVVYTLFAFFIFLVTIVIFMYFSRKKVIEKEIDKQKEILNAVINTQEQERTRISRDLHDEVSSKLTAISMHIYLLGQDDWEPKERTEMAENVFNACEKLIESTRQISHDLMPPTLDNMGLHFAIQELCKEFSIPDSIRITYRNDLEQDFFSGLEKEKQVHLFRIMQELINNSIKHGKISEIELTCTEINGVKRIIYTDNGKGINVGELSKAKGIGLKNIFSRSSIIDANAYIDTKYENGFYFTLTL